MPKLIFKIAFPIILAGIFAVTIFIALNYVSSFSYEKFDTKFYFIIFIFSIYIFSFGFSTGQNLISPLKELLKKATELNKGNSSSRAYIETKDELEELAKVFNEMAQELQTCRQQEVNEAKSVSIKVKAQTQELQEMINSLEQKVKNRTIEAERLAKQVEALKAEIQNKETNNKPKDAGVT